jgi:hypothetical protein
VKKLVTYIINIFKSFNIFKDKLGGGALHQNQEYYKSNFTCTYIFRCKKHIHSFKTIANL